MTSARSHIAAIYARFARRVNKTRDVNAVGVQVPQFLRAAQHDVGDGQR